MPLGALGRVADPQNFHRRFGLFHEIVDAHNRSAALLQLRLKPHRRVRDLPLEPARFDSANDPALRVDLREQPFGLALERVGERFHVVRSSEGIGDVRNSGLVGQDLLRAKSDTDCFLGRQCEGLVECVGVE
jgi:hypothetical protein